MAFLTYDEDNLIGAGARVLYAPIGTTLPTYPSDIFDGTSPYNPKTGWVDFGATSAAPQISRNLTTAGFQIQQTTSTLLEEPTDISRTLTVPVAEFSPAILALLEESTAATYAAGSKRGPGTKIPFGSINSLSAFRLALAVRKSKKQGINTEGVTGVTRGSFVVWTAYNCSLVGDNLQTSIGRGELASLSVQFKCYPDSSISTEGAEYGAWMIEDSGVTVATS